MLSHYDDRRPTHPRRPQHQTMNVSTRFILRKISRRSILSIRFSQSAAGGVLVANQTRHHSSHSPQASGVVSGSLSGAKGVSKILNSSTNNCARLLVKGPDASGIVASYSQLLYGHGCGIVDCASESSESDYEIDGRMFFQRIVFDHSSMQATKELIEKEVEDMSFKFGMGSQLVSI